MAMPSAKGPSVVSIHIAPKGSAKMQSVPAAKAVAGRGLEGDRYYNNTGTYSRKPGPDREITLIEAEAVEAAARDEEVEAPVGDIRRNVVTRGVALNHLVGREFRVGSARLKGIRLCEPCGHMEELAGKPGIEAALIHRGGLRAQIVESGSISVGDPVVVP